MRRDDREHEGDDARRRSTAARFACEARARQARPLRTRRNADTSDPTISAGTRISWSRTNGATSADHDGGGDVPAGRRRERAGGEVERGRGDEVRDRLLHHHRGVDEGRRDDGADRREQRVRPRHQRPGEGVGREDRRRHDEHVEGLDRAVGRLQVVDPPERRDQPREQARAPVLDAPPGRCAGFGDRPRDLGVLDLVGEQPGGRVLRRLPRRRGRRRRGTRRTGATARSRRSTDVSSARACGATVVTRRSRLRSASSRSEWPAAPPAPQTVRRRGARSRCAASSEEDRGREVAERLGVGHEEVGGRAPTATTAAAMRASGTALARCLDRAR